MNHLQQHLLSLAPRDKNVAKWVEHIQGPKSRAPIDIQGLEGSSMALAMLALAQETQRPIVIVAPSNEAAEEMQDDLTHLGWPRLGVFPSWEILPYELDEPVLEITAKRLDCYALWLGDAERGEKGAPSVTVISADALMQRVPAPERLSPLRREIRWGEPIEVEQLAEDLVAAGYERVGLVESRGEFSIRGSIIDIYPPTQQLPIRLDLWGDDIESIKHFDPITQRSVSDQPEPEVIVLEPASEQALMRDGELIPLADWLPRDAVIHFHRADQMSEHGQRFRESIFDQYDKAVRQWQMGDPDDLEENPKPRPPEDLYLTQWDDAVHSLEEFPRSVQATMPTPWCETKQEIEFHVTSFKSIEPELNTYLDTMRTRRREGALVVVACDNDGQVMRLVELMREADIDSCPLYTREQDAWKPTAGPGGIEPVILSVGPLHHGFAWRSLDLMVVTDREMFGRYRRRHSYRKFHRGTPISQVDEIKRGDHVVHVEKGVGVFEGTRQQVVDGELHDFMELRYAEGNKLLVPVDKIRLVQRYSVSDNETPALDKLGSRKWLNRKKRSEKKIQEMAEDLLKLYAQRAASEGQPCSPDTAMMNEFEASFLYPETPDQAKAIDEVKRDLEGPRPMDRLICGDVGFGKTEVAIRAAFKMAQEGRQVAFLCPTTILAQQHWTTFRERFAEYPINVDVISRFRTEKQQRETLDRTRAGKVDVLIGTHRLLSKDVQFLDLGLVIIDEEQRFGVRHKEKLKKLRASIDVLTLSATPIPRTLHMALSGLRDMSLIQTPPADRLPIKTKIIHWEEDQIAEAVQREMNRGGQVYFVHNRVQTIHDVKSRLESIVPQARISIAHGQMTERQLEDIFTEFVEGNSDILVATTIIENGVDIPNVNTILVNRADAFGLAQLYQLRGRVGRDVKRSYAYMIVPDGEEVTDQAVRRLATLEEFCDLGVGFQIALRDMEIRGTGNLLGGEQHGVMESIGFELYCEMLDEAIKGLKGEPIAPWREVEIRWPVSALLPAHYIPMESQRLALYKRLSVARHLEDVDQVERELRDRFGRMPGEVISLLQVARLRILAGVLGLTKITSLTNGVALSGAVWTDVIDRVNDVQAPVKKIEVQNTTEARILIPDLGSAARLSHTVELFKKWAARISHQTNEVLSH